MDESAYALKCLDEGYNCAQSVFSAYCEKLGIEREQGRKLTSGLGGGVAGLGGMCGAVSGACLLIGLKYGPEHSEEGAAKEKVNATVREFISRFESRYKTIVCNELLGAMPLKASPEELAQRRRVCNHVVIDAAKIVGRLLED